MIFTRSAAVILSVLLVSAAGFAQKERTISAVQGNDNISKFEGDSVRLRGIVTARTRNGFFIQTPDGETDDDPTTSEGIYVFTKTEPTAEASVGNLVSVSGVVQEFRPKSAVDSLTVTELVMRRDEDTIKVVSRENQLPAPVLLGEAAFRANSFFELEPYEGMRVRFGPLTAVSPTGGSFDLKNGISISNGVFFAVLKGTPRPFREIGMDVHDLVLSGNIDDWKRDHPKIAVFDSNPEAVRFDTSGQLGAQPLDLTTGVEIDGISGVMHYTYGKYTVLADVDSRPAVSGFIKSQALPAPNERQFSFAGMNLENFFDDEDDPSIKEEIVTRESFEKRMIKMSLAIRDYLRYPDVIGVTEAENKAALKRLADKINKDAVAAGAADPKYSAYLIDGNDPRGIDVGYLVKTSRVRVVKVEQFGRDEKFRDPKDKEDEILNDRPPLLLQIEIADAKTGKAFPVSLIANHLKSLRGYDDPKDGERVRTKKKIQAEFLAKFIQSRQQKDPAEKIVVLGDFNAFQFNDGITDVIGTIKGTPAGRDEVLMASDDLVNPDLIDLVDLIQADQRYSYIYDGNAQVLDHMLITQNLRPFLMGFGYARLNADFPEVYRNLTDRVERFSDHDAAVAYFTFDEKKPAN